jgi:molybdopterin molybdotransferase
MAQLTDDCFAFGGPMMTVEEAASLIVSRIAPISAREFVALGEADGRVLAKPLIATVALPSFDNSAVDGYAVRYDDLAVDGDTMLFVRGRVTAGGTAQDVRAAEAAVRIFTGAPMPRDADTVFMQEDVTFADDKVVLPSGLKRGSNRRLAGEDIAIGATALDVGRILAPQDIALAAALGVTQLDVRPRLRVGVFSTGNEVTEPGEALRPSAIYDANRHMLMAMVRRAGAIPVDLGILRDEPASLALALRKAAATCDLILTSGGVSTGEEDHVKSALDGAGSLVFWRIAIKPGRPVAMGVVAGTPCIGLPGNPVAVFVTFAAIVRPLIARLMGASPPALYRVPVTSGFDYTKKSGRREYVRVTLSLGEGGQMVAAKYAQDGAGVLTSLTRTDGLLELPDSMTQLAKGETVPFLPYSQLV